MKRFLLLFLCSVCVVRAQYTAPNTAATSAFTQSGTGAVATTVDAKLKQGWTTPEDFGALGGTANDTAAFNLMIARMNAIGGSYYMPGDRYTITAALTPILGVAAAATSEIGNLKLTGNSKTTIIASTVTSGAPFTFGNHSGTVVTNIELADFAVVGPTANVWAGAGSAATWDNATVAFDFIGPASGVVWIHGVRFFQFGEAGYRVDDWTGVTVGPKNYFKNCKRPGALGYKSDTHKFFGNAVSKCYYGLDIGYLDTRYRVTTPASNGVTISDNTFTGCRIPIVAGGNATEGITIFNNYFEDSELTPVEFGHNATEFTDANQRETYIQPATMFGNHFGASHAGANTCSVKLNFYVRKLFAANMVSPQTNFFEFATATVDANTDLEVMGIRNSNHTLLLSTGVQYTDFDFRFTAGKYAATTLGGNLTTAGAVTFSGAFGTTITLSGTTSVTLPTSGTLASTANDLSAFASTTSAQLRTLLSDESGTGAAIFAGGALGAATATSINGNTFTTGTYTLTGVASKTLTFNNTLTFAGTDGTTMTFPATSATIARTDAANTFTGIQTMTSPVIANLNPAANFTLTQNSVSALNMINASATANTIYTQAGNVAIGGTTAGYVRLEVPSVGDNIGLGIVSTSTSSSGYPLVSFKNTGTGGGGGGAHLLYLKQSSTSQNIITADNNTTASVFTVDDFGKITTLDAISIGTAGKTMSVKSGTNALAGTFTLASGTATVSSTAVDGNTVIVCSVKTSSGTLGTGSPECVITAGTGFTATGIATDNSTYNWIGLKVN